MPSAPPVGVGLRRVIYLRCRSRIWLRDVHSNEAVAVLLRTADGVTVLLVARLLRKDGAGRLRIEVLVEPQLDEPH